MDRHISDRFLPLVNRYSDRCGSKLVGTTTGTHCDGTIYAEVRFGIQFTKSSRPTTPVRFSMRVNDLCRPGQLLFMLYRIALNVGTKSYQVYNEHNLRVDIFAAYANNRHNESTLNVARKREFVLVIHKLSVHIST